MRKAKATTGTARKTSSPVRARRPAPASPSARSRHVGTARKRKVAPSAEPVPAPEELLARAQSDVVAAKFQGDEKAPRPRPTLPLSYGESHLLLLPRDPQTLFATWDLSPSLIDGLKARLGARGFAVSTLTLRLSSEGAESIVFHVGRRVRSRYLKVAGGASFTAEIGFTTPTGRFELAARSVPCFLPLGPARSAFVHSVEPAVASYRAARRPARTTASSNAGAADSSSRSVSADVSVSEARSASSASTDSAASAPHAAVIPFRAPSVPSAPRILGGASDLYRR